MDDFSEQALPAYRAVAKQIEIDIKSGQLVVGELLPNETKLAQKYGVNRSSMRESLRLLEDVGFVARTSPRKLVAAIPSTSKLTERAEEALFFHGVTIREVWEANLAIEPSMARKAAEKATEEDIRKLSDNVRMTEKRVSNDQPIDDLDHAFHKIIGEACHHLPLQIAREPFSDLFLTVVDGLVHHPEIGRRLLEAHSRIAEAIERRDAEAAEIWCRRHVLDFERGCLLNGVDMDVSLGNI